MKRLPYLAITLLFCACDEAQKVEPYAGQSAHWQQSAVPISLKCAACHAKEFEDWAGSDHAWAYRVVLPELDSEPFHGQRLQAHGSELRFTTTRDGKLQITDGKSQRNFTVHSVLGRKPLVQYLVEGKDGGLHTPSAAWDIALHEWFDMFEADKRLSSEGSATRKEGDWGHWLGRGMNWNSQCAWCHTSHFRKNYDLTTDTYKSTWKEPGVSCIQCHKISDKPSDDGCLVATADRKLSAQQMHDNCATCHARREELDDTFTVGDKFDDHFRLELPIIPGIFWPNGMQRDEDYCETGLRLSRMGRAGVTCLDCHDHHTATLKLSQEDNSLCMRCHATGTMVGKTATPIINPTDHSPCPPDSKGGRCVECHMPESMYMARDPRRDHSFNSPSPELSVELGLPNACLNCHSDKDNTWAASVISQKYPERKSTRDNSRTRAVHNALAGQDNTQELLAAFATEEIPGWRATLLELMARQQVTSEVLQAARASADDENAMVRAAAAKILGKEALTLIHDPIKLVRRAAAWQNIGNLHNNPQAAEAMAELSQIAEHQSDQPTGAMLLAMLADARGNAELAEHQYKRAIELDPSSAVAYMDFAVFLARQNRPMDALQQMLKCTKVAPDNPEAFYRLGLILAELQHFDYALSAFDKALQLSPAFHPARYNKAVVLQHLGRQDEAQNELNMLRALQTSPTK
ncbi:MAG: tetratricopeptide repeat protein [Akkermansia sp.]|nr:tetratricopeptide repeat protein [Akkermansia sp.]